MKQLTLGIVAHVDAGKTTLSEGILYTAGALRKLGRVDHRDAFLDTDTQERERGITIFLKQAVFSLGDTTVTLVDTPGHVDFSTEMERTLNILDCAILVISGTDGVQAHTKTLWRLLERYHVPTILFVNKMDLSGANRQQVLSDIRLRLSDSCVDAESEESLQEAAAMGNEQLLERYLTGESIEKKDIRYLVGERKLFPCIFGSALKLTGIDTLLKTIEELIPQPSYGEEFDATVYKISRDGNDRLTHMKLTGGSLKVRQGFPVGEGETEKVTSIRIYNGTKYETVDEATAGMVCAVTGLTKTKAGDVILKPVLTYRVLLPQGVDAAVMLPKLRLLEEEDPQLTVTWDEVHQSIHMQLMGEVQLEVIGRLINDRFGVAVAFDEGSIVYKETIAAPTVGIGHFEPLRHYAEVHLLLEPGQRGSGITVRSACGVDRLELNWQRLIFTHVLEREHKGVLTGAGLTDVKITLLTGKAHLKHTEGGDFRQATYRAIRHGLMQAESVLLEPYYRYTLTVPQENVGRAMTDLQRFGGSVEGPTMEPDGTATLTGTAPVALLRGYPREVAAYTRGQGSLSCEVEGYAPCHDTEAVVAAMQYDPESDLDNSPDSVFCDHGAGFVVPWREVKEYAHLENGWGKERREQSENAAPRGRYIGGSATSPSMDEELLKIFERTYGAIKNRGMDALAQSRKIAPRVKSDDRITFVHQKDWLIVDGYNIIFAWEHLKKLARLSLDDARNALINALVNYQGIRGCRITLVFDAYLVKGGSGTSETKGEMEIVYTKEGETADTFIERMSYELSRKYRVKVATSDGLEQILVTGHGAQRISAGDLRYELAMVEEQIRDFIASQ